MKILAQLKNFEWKLFLKSYWLIICLTIIGAFLRLYNFHSTLMFLGDQGRDALIVQNLLKHFDPILVGPTTSVGKIQLGPFYYYFMAPFLLLANFDPIGPALAIVFLGIFSIPLFYFVCQKMFGKNLGIIASILYTFSNVVITFTRFSWNPNPLPLLVIFLIYFFHLVYQGKKYQYIPWLFVLFAIALQLHYMILLTSPAILVLFILIFLNDKKNRKIILKKTKLAIFFFFILAIPLILFDLLRDFLNTKGIIEFFQKSNHNTSSLSLVLPRFLLRIKQITAGIIDLKNKELKAIFSFLTSAIFLIYSFLNRQNKAVQIIVLFFFSSLFGLTLYSSDVYEHYLTFFYPISIIVISLVLELIWNQKVLGKIGVSFFIIFIIFTNLKQYRFYEPLGWTISDTRKLSSVIAEDIGKDAYNIVLLDETKDYRAMQYRYFLNNTNIYSYNDYSPEILYLITQWDKDNIKTLELGELILFFMDDEVTRKLAKMNPEENARFLETKIIKSWYFPNGPYVYKLHK